MKCMYMPDEYFVQVFSVLKALHIFPKVFKLKVYLMKIK